MKSSGFSLAILGDLKHHANTTTMVSARHSHCSEQQRQILDQLEQQLITVTALYVCLYSPCSFITANSKIVLPCLDQLERLLAMAAMVGNSECSVYVCVFCEYYSPCSFKHLKILLTPFTFCLSVCCFCTVHTCSNNRQRIFDHFNRKIAH